MSLINQYVQVLEGNTVGNLKAGQPLVGDVKVNELETPDGVDTSKPKEGPSQKEGDGDPKELKDKSKTLQNSSVNPFDALYNKILSEGGWEAEDDLNNGSGGFDDMAFSGDLADGSTDLVPDSGDFGSDEDGDLGEDGGEDSSGDPMSEVLDALRAAVSALEKVLDQGGEDEEESFEGDELGEGNESEQEGGDEGEGEDDEEEKESVTEEEVDAEELGTALVDLEKLAASLNNPKSQVVKGAVPLNKGKAQTPKGPKVDGKPTELKNGAGDLENRKSQDTKLVKTGKSWFDQ